MEKRKILTIIYSVIGIITILLPVWLTPIYFLIILPIIIVLIIVEIYLYRKKKYKTKKREIYI